MDVTETEARNFPDKSITLGIGRVNIWKAVLFSISLEMAGEPKNTEANTGREDKRKPQSHPNRSSFSLPPLEITPNFFPNIETSPKYLNDKYINKPDTTSERRNIR